MGASKDLFMDVRIQAETSEELWDSLPNEFKEVFNIKRIEAVNFKEHYRKDKKWNELHKEMVDAIKARTEREEQIRTDLR